jgi:hypothetical protein
MVTICRSFEPVVVEMFWEFCEYGYLLRRLETHSRLDTAVVENSALQPGNEEMGSFRGRLTLH